MTVHLKAAELPHHVIRTLCGRELINGTGAECKSCAKIQAKRDKAEETSGAIIPPGVTFRPFEHIATRMINGVMTEVHVAYNEDGSPAARKLVPVVDAAAEGTQGGSGPQCGHCGGTEYRDGGACVGCTPGNDQPVPVVETAREAFQRIQAEGNMSDAQRHETGWFARMAAAQKAYEVELRAELLQVPAKSVETPAQAPAVKAAPAHTACGFRLGCASGRFAIHTLTEDLPVGTAGTHLCAYHSPYDAGTVADEPTGTCVDCGEPQDRCAGHTVWSFGTIAPNVDADGTVTVDLGRFDRAPIPGTTKRHFKGGEVTYRFTRDGVVEVLRAEGSTVVYSRLPMPTVFGATVDLAPEVVIPEPVIGGTGRPSVTVALQLADASFLLPGDVITWADESEIRQEMVVDEVRETAQGDWRVWERGGSERFVYYARHASLWVLRDSDTVPTDGRYRMEASRAGGAWLPSDLVEEFAEPAKGLMRLSALSRLVPDSRFRLVDTVTGRVIHEQLRTVAEVQSAVAVGAGVSGPVPSMVDGPRRFRAVNGKRKPSVHRRHW